MPTQSRFNKFVSELKAQMNKFTKKWKLQMMVMIGNNFKMLDAQYAGKNTNDFSH